MKHALKFLFIITLVFGFSMQAQAALQVLGTDNNGNRLIYDNDLNITWYDYTKSADTWQNQMDWASTLSIYFGSSITGWRLPTTTQPDSSCSSQYNPGGGVPIQGYGYNCTASEMGHLFALEPSRTTEFQKLGMLGYWSSTEYAPGTGNAWYYAIGDGYQYVGDKTSNVYAIAVHDGNISVVPEPISSILFITGGTLLAGRRFIRLV